jgi:aquaporin Z
MELGEPLARRALMGLAMGATAVALIYSPLGRRSGAHMNPAVTLSFFGLGKLRTRDAAAYVVAQFAGGAAGIALAALVLEPWLAAPSVHYVVTRGVHGPVVAFAAELAISFVLLSVVLRVASVPRLERFAGLCAGALVALYITLEAPLSGMSMNPARSLASALGARDGGDLWIYFTAPLAGMFAAAAWFARASRVSLPCAKLRHDERYRCIFCGHEPRNP